MEVKSQNRTKAMMNKHRKRRLFKVIRYNLRYNLGLFYTSFVIFDYLYIYPYWLEGLLIRSIFYVGVWLLAFSLKLKAVRNNLDLAACIVTNTIGLEIDWLIYRSGGYSSFYITGLCLGTLISLQMFGFNRRWAIRAAFINLIPGIAVVWWTAGSANWLLALLQTGFMLLTIGMAWYYNSFGDTQALEWAFRQLRSLQQIEVFRRTEFLKRTFPPVLREEIESGKEEIPKKKLLENAVLGFADISSSTSIGNAIELSTDWILKEEFLKAAVRRGTENGLIVLSSQGDGVFFLANYRGGDKWPLNVIAFFENLLLDYKQSKSSVGIDHLAAESGIKFGLAMGPAMLGFIGTDQSQFTANGPTVNMASRLCAEADADQLVVNAQVWEILRPFISGWEYEEEVFTKLKGFKNAVSAVRIHPRMKQQGRGVKCAKCGSPLMVISTNDGTLDVKCANGHRGDEVGSTFMEKKAA